MNKTTNNISLCIFIILTILIIAFIFSNSLKNSEESNAQSGSIVKAVETVLDPEDKIPTNTFNYIVRKAAHITEFAVLGIMLGRQVWCVKRIKRKNAHSGQRIIAALLAGLAIASIDEIIQSFTGRTSSVSDVLIDFVGVVLGMMIVLLMNKLPHKNGTKEQ